MLKHVMFKSSLIVFACCLAVAAHAMADEHKQINVPAGDLIVALKTLAGESGAELVYRSEQLEGMRTKGVSGLLTAKDAVTKLLEGTPLTLRVDSSGAMLIALPRANGGQQDSRGDSHQDGQPHAGGANDEKQSASDSFRVAQVDHSEGEAGQNLEEVVVTGTLIRGAEPASRVSTYTRTEIEAQGFSSVKDFIQSLPLNVGTASQNTLASVAGGSVTDNQVNAAGVNLRGLGNDATLVLLNGQRVAPGNNAGNFVDISLIPLSAIERIEVMPDGASALYGSDAVGGVVNFILRSDIEGGETGLRFGAVTRGGRHDIQASQVLGHDWGTGSVMLVYDFDNVTALNADARDFTARTTTEPFDLLPRQTTQSVVLTGQQSVTSALQLFGNGTFSHRDGYTDISYFGASYHLPESIDSYTATAGVRGDLSKAVRFELSSNYGTSHSNSATSVLSNDGEITANPNVESDVFSVDAKFDGTLTDIPTGPVLFAVGGQFRRQEFSYTNTAENGNFSDSRSISAGFLEVRIPLIGAVHPDSHGNILELDAAGRFEHYSDFGSTHNPKVGLIWNVVPGLKARASYGTSFVAPLLTDLNPLPSQVAAIPGTLFGNGVPDSLVVFGGNPGLKAQKSRNWAFSLDWNPPEIEGLAAYANYYRISYSDRISNAGALISLFDVFQGQNETLLGPGIIQRNVPASSVRSLEASPNFVNIGVADPGSIDLIINSRQQNLSSVKTSGIDFGSSYVMIAGPWRSEIGIDGTYVLRFDDQITAASPETSFLNQPYNPLSLKFRARGSLQRGPTTVGLFLNFVDSYSNPFNGQVFHVASWETLDATARFDFADTKGPFSGASATLSVANLADKAPPFVANASIGGVDFDGVNANVLGRFISLQLLKRW